jgi:hypothetical protein
VLAAQLLDVFAPRFLARAALTGRDAGFRARRVALRRTSPGLDVAMLMLGVMAVPPATLRSRFGVVIYRYDETRYG